MLSFMSRLVELSHGNSGDPPRIEESFAGIVIESVGPFRHEVSVPFHDSQVKGKAVLIQTGWDQRWGGDSYWEPGPTLADSLIFRLVRSGVRILGVDFWISGPAAGTQLLLEGKIPIVENLRNLSSVPRWGFRFATLPLSPPAGTSYPVRVFAEIPPGNR